MIGAGSARAALSVPENGKGEKDVENIAYYNGKTGPIEEMMVPMNDRACYFGDGVYDATMAVNHVPMHFDDHIDRIYNSARLIDIEIPMPKE